SFRWRFTARDLRRHRLPETAPTEVQGAYRATDKGAVARPTGCLSAPASTAILGSTANCGPTASVDPEVRHRQSRSAMCLSAVSGAAPLLTLCQATVTASLPDLEPISLSFRAPVACTWETDGAIHVPSQQSDRPS